MTSESQIEQDFIARLEMLKSACRLDIPDKAALEANFRQYFQTLSALGLGWKERSKKETALMQDLLPLLRKLAQGREISGLQAYEQ